MYPAAPSSPEEANTDWPCMAACSNKGARLLASPLGSELQNAKLMLITEQLLSVTAF
jgi:hypothetical protein